MRLFTLLKKAFTKLGLIADYMVETGSNGEWTWQKYNSGIVKLFCIHRYNNYEIACKTAYGNYYCSAELALSLPISLVNHEEAAVSVSISGAGVEFPAKVRLTATNKVTYRWCNGSPYDIYGSPLVSVQITGYWKTPTLGGGYYLVGLSKGGVGYALIHLAERHYPLYPFGKEFTYRWKHARRWIHSFPKWIQDVLGDRKQFKGSKHSDLADIIFRWICVSVSKLQYRDNNAVLLFCSFNTRRKHIQGVQLQHSEQSAKHGNKFKYWISGSRILIRGGDSYAAI